MSADLELIVSQAAGTDLAPAVAELAARAQELDLCAVCLNPETVACEQCGKHVCPAHSGVDAEDVEFCHPCWDALTSAEREGGR